ncbi:MAG TPA: GGDEF domain-containing protein [Kineosporiaceae bacterium]|nr:GGDEF domain-containing protein [Kineosporiaceae bacterium]
MATDQVTGAPGRPQRGDRSLAGALRIWALLALYTYLGALAVFPHTFRLWRDFGLQNLTLGLACAYHLAMIRADPRHRSWRLPLAGWPLAMFLGNLLSNAHTGPQPATALAVASIAVMLPAYPCAFVAIVQIHRGRWTAFTRGAVLDSLVAALAIWAAFTAFVLPPAIQAAEIGRVNPVLVLAFPICDLTVLTITVGAVALSGARPERMSGWLILAIVIYALADSAFAIENALGAWQYGTVLDGTWVVGVCLVSLGAAAGPRSRRTSRTWGAGVLVVPLVSASVAISLLVIGTRWPLSTLGIGLATASAAVALLRLADAYIQVQALSETERLAATDDLTALANRRAFYRQVEDRLDRRHPFAVVLVDLDKFKEVNDTLGHAVGDELLFAVARRLESGLPEDALLARLGGDEFAVCADLPGSGPDPQPQSAIVIAERMLATLHRPIIVAGETLTIGASLGVAVFPAQAASRGELMRRADVAMYAAKRAGGGVRLHAPEDDDDLLHQYGRRDRERRH